jgi:hypothetical protein
MALYHPPLVLFKYSTILNSSYRQVGYSTTSSLGPMETQEAMASYAYLLARMSPPITTLS